MRPLLLFCLLLLFPPVPSPAQVEKSEPQLYVPRPLSLWASAGLGLSSFAFVQGSDWGISTTLGGAVRHRYVTLKYKWTQQRQFTVVGFVEHLSVQEILLGYAFDIYPRRTGGSGRTRLGVYAGLGQARYRHRGPPERTISSMITGNPITTTAYTVPFEFELEHHLAPHLGASIFAFVSFSSLQPLFGLSFSVRAGLL